jgi:6-phospho-3-hexuloisomerase
MTVHDWLALDLAEVTALLRQIDESEASLFAQAILQANTIFVTGQGRSGLVMRMFALRLMQLGLRVHVVGDAVTPPIGQSDLLIVGSASGETASAVRAAQKAKSCGARVATLTARRDSTAARLADFVVFLPGSSPKLEDGPTTRLPMGSTVEQAFLILLDAVIASLAVQLVQSDESMMARHANLE